MSGRVHPIGWFECRRCGRECDRDAERAYLNEPPLVTFNVCLACRERPPEGGWREPVIANAKVDTRPSVEQSRAFGDEDRRWLAELGLKDGYSVVRRNLDRIDLLRESKASTYHDHVATREANSLLSAQPELTELDLPSYNTRASRRALLSEVRSGCRRALEEFTFILCADVTWTKDRWRLAMERLGLPADTPKPRRRPKRTQVRLAQAA